MSAISSQITSLTIVYSTVYSGADQRKLQSSSLAFVRGIHRWPANNAENVSIWWRHHEWSNIYICIYIYISSTTNFTTLRVKLIVNMIVLPNHSQQFIHEIAGMLCHWCGAPRPLQHTIKWQNYHTRCIIHYSSLCVSQWHDTLKRLFPWLIYPFHRVAESKIVADPTG